MFFFFPPIISLVDLEMSMYFLSAYLSLTNCSSADVYNTEKARGNVRVRYFPVPCMNCLRQALQH